MIRWGGNFAVELAATLPWNQWQLSRGISGNFAVESVATLPWNQWQLCRGIRSLPKKHQAVSILAVF
jgi:hypothetical protein